MGKKTSETSSTTTLPAWAQNAAQGAVGSIQNTVNSNAGNLQGIADSVRGTLPDLRHKMLENPTLDQGNAYLQNVLGGKYLNNNPYMDQMAALARDNAGNMANQTFSMAGRTGGGNHHERFGQGVANAELGVRYGDYAQERQNQQQAAGMLPGMAAAEFAGVPAFLSASQTAGQLPYAGANTLASMGSLWGGQGTTTQTQPGGWGNQLLGAAASALPFILSDRRMKTKIKLLRRAPDGLGWYEFAYKFAPDAMQEGVMADEVKELRPHAYAKGFLNGEYDGVNYAELGAV